MATYVLVHGAGGTDSWYWHRVVPELRKLGHDVVAPDLPIDDATAGLGEFADVVVNAIGSRTDLILVAQSMAGFTAPLVCERVPVDLLVLVAAMVPAPGESASEWWTNTEWERAVHEDEERTGRSPADRYDPLHTFLHDVPREVVAEAMARGVRGESAKPFEQPWPLTAWPDVPTKFLLCSNDRFFPAEFQRRVARERLGVTPDELDSGHTPALSHPTELVARLEAYRAEVERTR
jgi:pimeloyl-ACP methyl ester carboxylesterase